MKRAIELPAEMYTDLVAHLFKSRVEEGAFVFAEQSRSEDALVLRGVDLYLVPPEGWAVQTPFNLELTDEERARILRIARDRKLCLVDCHSHRGFEEAFFSPSDRQGIEEFAPYVRWKLDGRPYIAIVFDEASVDAVVWHGDFERAQVLDELVVLREPHQRLVPTGSWFRGRRAGRDNG